MTRCQVVGCRSVATVRCETGYALCARHRDHTHAGVLGRGAPARSWAIRPDGSWLHRRVLA